MGESEWVPFFSFRYFYSISKNIYSQFVDSKYCCMFTPSIKNNYKMKTFKHIEFKPCNDIDGVRGQIEINGQVVSIISGVRTQSIGSRLVKNHWSFEVAVWDANDSSKWTTKKWIRGAQGIQFPIKGGMNRRQINALLKKIQSA